MASLKFWKTGSGENQILGKLQSTGKNAGYKYC